MVDHDAWWWIRFMLTGFKLFLNYVDYFGMNIIWWYLNNSKSKGGWTTAVSFKPLCQVEFGSNLATRMAVNTPLRCMVGRTALAPSLHHNDEASKVETFVQSSAHAIAGLSSRSNGWSRKPAWDFTTNFKTTRRLPNPWPCKIPRAYSLKDFAMPLLEWDWARSTSTSSPLRAPEILVIRHGISNQSPPVMGGQLVGGMIGLVQESLENHIQIWHRSFATYICPAEKKYSRLVAVLI